MPVRYNKVTKLQKICLGIAYALVKFAYKPMLKAIADGKWREVRYYIKVEKDMKDVNFDSLYVSQPIEEQEDDLNFG